MSKLLELLSKKSTAGLNADQGLGGVGWWPACPNGKKTQVVEAFLTGMELKEDDKFRWNKPSPGQVEAYSIQFFYQLVSDPEHDGEPRSFNGRKIVVPYDESVLPGDNPEKGQKARVRIDKSVLLGMAKTLCNSEFDNEAAMIDGIRKAIEAAENAGTAIVLKVLLTYGDDGTPDREKWQERVS